MLAGKIHADEKRASQLRRRLSKPPLSGIDWTEGPILPGLVVGLDCAGFCAHPTDRRAHLRTASHMLRSRLSCFVSAATLKTEQLS
jgi:hypothetical protein